MDSTTDTLRQEIDQRRQAISDDVGQLENRVQEMTDFQHQYRERPMAFVGLAFGGGVLLGMLMSGGSDKNSDGRRRDDGRRYAYTTYSADQQSRQRGNGDDGGFVSSFMSGSPGSSTEAGKRRASSTFDEVRGALMAYAATRAEEFLKEALPGFNREVDKVRQEGDHSGQTSHQPQQPQPAMQSSMSSGSTTATRGEV